MKLALVAAGVLGLAGLAAQAQEAEPGVDLRKLDIWLGDWAYEIQNWDSDVREARVAGTATLSRFGEFYIFRSQSRGVSNISIWGYDHEKKVHVVEHFSSAGWRGTAVIECGERTITSETIGVSATGHRARTRCRKDLVAEPTEACETFKDGRWTPSSTITWRRPTEPLLPCSARSPADGH